MCHVKVESHPNPLSRSYHTDFEISKSHVQIFWRPLRPESREYLKLVGRRGSALLHKVFRVPGVNQVFINPYEIHVIKGVNFLWANIDPGILKALGEVLPKSLRPVPETAKN